MEHVGSPLVGLAVVVAMGADDDVGEAVAVHVSRRSHRGPQSGHRLGRPRPSRRERSSADRWLAGIRRRGHRPGWRGLVLEGQPGRQHASLGVEGDELAVAQHTGTMRIEEVDRAVSELSEPPRSAPPIRNGHGPGGRRLTVNPCSSPSAVFSYHSLHPSRSRYAGSVEHGFLETILCMRPGLPTS